jgi:hypothetical protein
MQMKTTILIGGKRRDARNYMQRAEHKARLIEAALMSKPINKSMPAEDRQLFLNFSEIKKG